MKKILSLFLSFSLLFSLLLPTFALDSEDSHAGHKTELVRLLTEENAGTDFCGEFRCADCGVSYYSPISSEDVGMPILNFAGSLNGISKENKVTVDVSYSSETLDFTSSATLKVQGASSAGFPKKNFTINFLNDDGKKIKSVSGKIGASKANTVSKRTGWITLSPAM